jgi:hypothetical protein
VTVAGKNQYATGTTSETTGSRPNALFRAGGAAQSGDTFLNLLFQDQMDASECATFATYGGAGSSSSGAGASQGSSAKTPCLLLASPISTETKTPSRRKEASDDPGTATPACVAPNAEMSVAARWLLSFTGGNASAASLGSGLDPELPAGSSGQETAAASLAQEGNASSDSAPLLGLTANLVGSLDNAIRGATLETVDAAPVAELRLTPSAIPAATNRVAAAASTASLTLPSAASSSTRLQGDSAVGLQSPGVTETNAVPETRVGDFDHGGESSFDQSATSQQAVFAVSNKKKAETSNAQSNEPAAISDPGVGDQRAATSPIATPPAESQSTRTGAEAPVAASSVLEPASTEPAKPPTASVGTIELQVRGADEQQVGLRFVERQGQVEIQLKSGDVQTAQALSDNLADLKTSLNADGWNVESRIQGRPSSTDQSSQIAMSPDHLGSPQTLRAEQISMGQMNGQSGSDSSAGKEHSRPDQDGASGKNEQQARNESAGSNSERHGRRSARDSEAWLESIESNLTRSPSSRVTTGVTK